MKITVMENEAAFDREAAWRIIGQMLSKEDSCIGLSTGQTTNNMLKLVSEIYAENPFNTENIKIFNVDELVNLPRSYKGSCYAMIKTPLCDTLKIREENFIMPLTMDADFEKECKLFEQRIEQAGGIDLQILGIGWNGHIGINQPGTPFERITWVSPMDPIFEKKVRGETGVPDDYYLGGLTLGVKNIMSARKLILVAKGKHKAQIIKKALEGPVTTDIPASVVQLHPNCEVLLDKDAASLLDL